ncbi:sodium- and chloride-dependent glycine transporter 2-like isoform X1 [Haliotis rubra]|uniref:sodium- and chloride-dependent glycine transporter 2-like isoform X1 n=2 Tax=Haliotis rubra TaxID=36100 RepID=UPI001EE634AA|nr:sodium- and chloride-dependent glycine transporter 2-like isoform X1 [Haliotis rubra]XP_046557788.1 sodium- and chloride-dependent glycine transporter 2-like isoform X1 [Haliotis rubra]XP_046557789.1 sodium- and chloride-dependent glycine transporter 2-like isoform X1 [Haliotis rubra]XP_046557790.1 sodium- and chloride-dependent glycine transporter 2-like isoform X1 [Haliotis rubra]
MVCLVLCGLPLFFLEVALGQFTGRSAMHTWSLCPLVKGLGGGMLIFCTGFVIYSTVICAWSLYYAFFSLRSVLPWTSCSNSWNTEACVTTVKHLNQVFSGVTNGSSHYNATTSNTSFVYEGLKNRSVTAAEEFWQHKALEITRGLEYLGPIKMELALCLLASWIVVFLCTIKGVRSVGKAVYVTATFPYIILIVLLIRGLTLPGGTDGALFYITPNFSKLLEIQVWLEACLQVFYSLGPAWGCIITMSSYNKFNTNCLRNAVFCTFVCEGTSMFAGLVIFSILGFMAHEADVPIMDVVSSGPGLGFVIYPEVLAQLPIPQLWSFIFFIMLIMLALDSIFSAAETCITAVTDEFRYLLKWRVLLTAAYCSVCFLAGLVMTTQGGVYVFQLLDWYLFSLFLIFCGCVECIVVSWVYGVDRFSDDIQMMIGRPAPLFFKITWCYVTPSMLLITLIFTFTQYEPPTYGQYVFPGYASSIGWCIAAVPMLPVGVMMVIAIYRAKGNIWQKIKTSLEPDAGWGPTNAFYRTCYLKKRKQPKSLRRVLMSSVSCRS